MHQYLTHLLQTYGYWGLCGLLALEYLFVPVPGETTLTTSGILWQQGSYHLKLVWLILATTFGTFTGSMFGYVIGRTLGRPFVEKFGRYIRITPKQIDRAESLFAKYTVPTLLISRYIAVVRILVPYIAGINRARLAVYIPVMLLGSLAWTSTFILAGGAIAKAWDQVVANWRHELIPAIFIAMVLVVGYWFLHRLIKHKMEAADQDRTTPSARREQKTDPKDKV
ncbi:DedA family protein [Alicyclobacillus tolerans]|uniref:DedA family protein n=1 Tax=Alicyclobacillus tolerans TaxID=90970 RepID=UPI001F2BC32B|nr:DedA family protein [Alicyclobacillus tolerans]MCF8567283.1 DedA family protein [Alicyclobacillus tolerans]